jgi:hypothetical protein
MRDQLLALLWLRLTLFRHTLTSDKVVSLALAATVLAGLVVLSIGAGVGLFLLGMNLRAKEAWITLVISDVYIGIFLFFWLFGLMMELQRSEIIDFRKMLYLPVSLPLVFLLNYAASLFSALLPLFVLPMLGLSIGLAIGLGARMLLVFPLGLVFYLMIGAWTYYVRGLVAMLMENKRRRRIVLAVIPLIFVVIGQGPNVVTHILRRDRIEPPAKETRTAPADPVSTAPREAGARPNNWEWVERANAAVPVGWLPYSVYALSEGRLPEAGLCFSGMMVLGGIGLGLGFRSTWRYYTGQARRPARVQRAPLPPARDESKRPLIARSLPFVDDDTSAVALAGFLTYVRQPNIYIMAVMPLLLGVGLLLMYGPNAPQRTPGFQQGLIPAVAALWPMFSFAFIMFNVFGMDRAGFRTLILLPTERRKYLLGKNLALLPIITGLSIVFVLVSAVILRPGPESVVFSLLQIPQLYLTFCILGNFISLYLPFRLAWEGLRRQEPNVMSFLTVVISFFAVAAAALPSAACRLLDAYLKGVSNASGVPFGLILSVIVLIATGAAYWRSLGPAGRLLSKREQWILDRVVRSGE